MKLSFGISVYSDLTNDLWKKKHDTHAQKERETWSWLNTISHSDSCGEPRLFCTNILKTTRNETYNDVTSGGKLRGISPALSHSALSLVHVHEEGHRGCLGFLLSTKSKTDATTSSSPSRDDLLGVLRVFSILANHCGHDLRLEKPYT